MALKKVRRPVKNGPNEDNIQTLKQVEMKLIENGEEGNSMNYLNTGSGSNLTAESTSLSNNSIQQSTAMERVFTFGDDFVSMKRIAKIAEGIYDFRIDDIGVKENVETQYGTKDQYVITFSLGNPSTNEITTLTLPYNISSNHQSALMEFLGAFKDVFRGKKITMRYLVGMTGQARVYHVVSEAGNVYEKIEILDVEKPNT
ncbi:hypothetical protein FZC78_09490 [Rossellomorea vietnamensis]|uniref:Uncharacterized protein n=1 Tax=Rossellomorea vietnamensis TaxID=218284 RepID=A0A5D4NVT1_9BACI|nr:hypothetical protein [Rossellomorea vietnamensis]TYS18050.1 hypothetical protein FZC78_09490 [Rossellomorea vietnamensis]